MDINELIDDCIDQLSDDRVESGVEALYDLAIRFKTLGMGRAFFANVCQYIEREATAKSDGFFIQMKIHNALIKIREQKHGVIARVRH